jgi:hypothetical protein
MSKHRFGLIWIKKNTDDKKRAHTATKNAEKKAAKKTEKKPVKKADKKADKK